MIVLRTTPNSTELLIVYNEAAQRHFGPHLGKSMGSWLLQIVVDLVPHDSSVIGSYA